MNKQLFFISTFLFLSTLSLSNENPVATKDLPPEVQVLIANYEKEIAFLKSELKNNSQKENPNNITEKEKENLKNSNSSVFTTTVDGDNFLVAPVKNQNEKKFTGNNVMQWKQERFVSQGSNRTVHEYVYGDGNINFSDGWGVGYIFKNLKITSGNVRQIGSEIELRPGYTWRFENNHWATLNGMYYHKGFHEQQHETKSNPNPDLNEGFSETGFGTKPNYGYWLTPKTLLRGEIKALSLDKNSENSQFNYMELIQAIESRFYDKFTLGLEMFYKDGADYNTTGDKTATVEELQARPYLSFNIGKMNLFFKVETGPATTHSSRPNGDGDYEHFQVKPIFALNYPLREDLYLLGETSWNHISDKKNPSTNEKFEDENIYFIMTGINYVF